jgi:hypothetical protein
MEESGELENTMHDRTSPQQQQQQQQPTTTNRVNTSNGHWSVDNKTPLTTNKQNLKRNGMKW